MPNHLTPGATPVSPLPAAAPGAGEASSTRTSTTRYLNIFTIGMMLLIGSILTLPISLPGRVQLTVGQPAPTDLYAPQYFRYESAVLTEQDRENARQAAGAVYDYNASLVDSQRRRLNDQLATIASIRSNITDSDLVRIQRLRQIANTDLSEDDIGALLDATPDAYSRMSYDVLRVFDNLMISGKIADEAQLGRVRADLPTFFTTELSAGERQAAADLLSPALGVNLILNPEKTEAAQTKAAEAVQSRIVEVQKGEIILRQGQIADAAAVEKLEHAGLSNPQVTAADAGAVFGCVMIMLLLLHFYMLRFQPGIWSHQRSLMLLALVLLAPTLGLRIIVPGHAVWPFMLPVAASSMLVAVLLDANLAIAITFVLGVFAALLTQGGFELAFFYVVGGMAAVFAIWRAERVTTFALSSLYIGVASLAAALLLRVVENQHLDLTAVWTLAAAAAINGVLSACLTFATFSVLGSLFGITTLLQLLELAHPTQPLLRRLMREAPGTYHHSLVVSNLVEHAAERVGADPLLARVAAYYHDIGKVLNPYAFIENQSGMENIHDTLDPVTSARLIREHITGGMDLARQSRLPRRIVDCIPQHHGTTMIRYFYHKALAEDPNCNEDDFRCPGPKPQSKEAAILMLADGVEATVRSMAQAGKLENPGPLPPGAEPPANSLRGIIRRIVHERLEEGQLDECDLTIRDLQRIQDAFYSMLKGIYHPRIIYPDKPALQPVLDVASTPVPAGPPGLPTGGARRGSPVRWLAPGSAAPPSNGHTADPAAPGAGPASGWPGPAPETPPARTNGSAGSADPPPPSGPEQGGIYGSPSEPT